MKFTGYLAGDMQAGVCSQCQSVVVLTPSPVHDPERLRSNDILVTDRVEVFVLYQLSIGYMRRPFSE